MSKRTVIDQKMCDMVKLMMAGKPKLKTVADMMGIGISTVQRIQAAGYDAEEYQKNTEARKETKAHKKIRDEKKTGGVSYEEEQVPGQMRMFMPEGGNEPPVQLMPIQIVDENKVIRFLAGKTELLSRFLAELGEKMDKIIDYQAQLLRKMDK